MRTPHLARALSSLLVPVSGGLLVGDVSRRVADAVADRAGEEVRKHDGRVTVILQSNRPQGFTVQEFGHTRMLEIDGIQLARIRVSPAEEPRPQEKISENGLTL